MSVGDKIFMAAIVLCICVIGFLYCKMVLIWYDVQRYKIRKMKEDMERLEELTIK